MQELNFKRIGERIRECRVKKCLTQEYISNKIGVNVSHISNIENDRVKVSLTICNTLGTTVDYILDNEYVSSDAIDREIMKELASRSPEMKEKILQIIRIL